MAPAACRADWPTCRPRPQPGSHQGRRPQPSRPHWTPPTAFRANRAGQATSHQGSRPANQRRRPRPGHPSRNHSTRVGTRRAAPPIGSFLRVVTNEHHRGRPSRPRLEVLSAATRMEPSRRPSAKDRPPSIQALRLRAQPPSKPWRPARIGRRSARRTLPRSRPWLDGLWRPGRHPPSRHCQGQRIRPRMSGNGSYVWPRRSEPRTGWRLAPAGGPKRQPRGPPRPHRQATLEPPPCHPALAIQRQPLRTAGPEKRPWDPSPPSRVASAAHRARSGQ